MHIAVGISFASNAMSKISDEPTRLEDPAMISAACSEISSAWDWMNDPTLEVLESTPIFGADLRAVRLVTKGAAGVCGPVTQLLTGFDEVNPLKTIKSLGASEFRELSFETLGEIGLAYESLESIDAKELHFGIDSQILSAKSALARVVNIEPELRSMVSVAAAMFSGEADSLWFIATQNLSEARGTGGILGSYGVVKVAGSDAKLVEAGSDQTLAEYGPVNFQSLPVDTSLAWGVEPSVWQDLNPSAHAPYTGQQIYDSWLGLKKQKLSGVVFIGQGWAQNLVGLVGSIKVDGVELNANNTAEFLAKDIYTNYPDVNDKNLFVNLVMKTLAEKVNSKELDLQGLITAIEKNKTGDKLFAWSQNDQVQSALVADGAAGFVDEKPGNRVWVAINNGGGNKLEAYLNTSVKYEVKLQKDQSNVSKLEVTLRNSAPEKNLPDYVKGRLDLSTGAKYIAGSNLDLVSIYLPIGAELTGFYLNNESYAAQEYVDRGHLMLSFRVYLDPGEEKNISMEWKMPKSANPTSEPKVFTNSSYNPVTIQQKLEK